MWSLVVSMLQSILFACWASNMERKGGGGTCDVSDTPRTEIAFSTHAMTMRSQTSFCRFSGRDSKKQQLKIDYRLDEWVWIPINWGDARDSKAIKYHDVNKFKRAC